MPDAGAQYARLSRVTTRRGTLRQLNCPLEPELLVAEFSEELPPDVAVAVREHMAVCEICGKRAQELRVPYSLLSSLGNAPAPYVPDLRESVRVRTARTERFFRPMRALVSLGRFGVIVSVIAVVTLLALVFGVTGLVRSLGIFSVGRTTNQLQNVSAAAARGMLLAETDKLVTVTGADGVNWQVAEIIVTNQRNGQVERSEPASNSALHAGSATTLPAAVATDGRLIYELTATENGGQQALVAFDATTGDTRFVAPLRMPNGDDLPAEVRAMSLAVAPDGSAVYVGLSGATGALNGPRALVITTRDGKLARAISLTTPDQIPLPPPPGSLPASAFPSVVPFVSIHGMSQTAAADGAIALSPDGQALFDLVLASDAHGVRYAIVRRIALTSNQVTVLGLQGSFAVTRFAASLSSASPQVYVVTGSPQAVVYVVDATAQGPTLLGQIALGGPVATSGARLQDTLAVNPTANGVWLYVTQDATASDGTVTAHNRWLVDTQGMGVIASATDPTSAGAILGNQASQGKAFALINGQIKIGAPDLSSGWGSWFQTNDNTPIIRLIATTP
jgi:hypothetical protein